MNTTYTAASPEVQAFLVAWHEMERPTFARYTALDYDSYKQRRAVDRSKYVALDWGGGDGNWSGCYLVDKATGMVWTIKAYGRPNRRAGQIEALTARFRAAADKEN